MEYYPFVVLAVGLVSVVGLMVALRANAFLALIVSAMIVSLMAPGPLEAKIKRAAEAFGSTAGGIGIVIALAAVIGKCLMESGAADRIVRSFLRVLGEKRAATALTGSGFVLAVPVFFDTVFYLLVPLARSLWLRTRRNYVLYLTAIAAGGAITHTLVPPTPGPLFMAERLGIDMGVMIVVGAFIGIPMAVAGLVTCRIMNRLMDIPMRPLGGKPDPEPLPDDQLPAFWLSLAPVLLPVVLISINTITTMVADAEHAARLRAGDIKDWSLVRAPADGDVPAARETLGALWQRLPEDLRQQITTQGLGPEQETLRAEVRAAINQHVLESRTFFNHKAFRNVDLPKLAEPLLGRGLDRVRLAEVERFNRLLLETGAPGLVAGHTWETPRRQVAQVTAVLGDANLALLISAVIAMATLRFKRGLSLRQLSATTEDALMSAGVIILITAAGGAFGGMLRQAGIRDSVQEMFASGGQVSALGILAMAFTVAAVLKVAQGSSTVAIMTTSSMMAAMGVSPEMVGFNLVYLAAVIACGSLVGSWMNDSGFWIFTRMGGLTESESLRTWTILLIVIAVTGLAVSMLLATLVPLV